MVKLNAAFFKKHRTLIAILAAISVLSIGTGITLAILSEKTPAITNTFTPANASVAVREEFNGVLKKNVTVYNDGDLHEYVRIKLVTYRVDDNGKPIGGAAAIPAFTPGTGWLSTGNDTYIYSLPVAPKSSPAQPLIGASGIELKDYAADTADLYGGKQVIEVIAESVQSSPADAVKEAWNVNVNAATGAISLKS